MTNLKQQYPELQDEENREGRMMMEDRFMTKPKKPIIKKYHSKDLNIAYNNGLADGKAIAEKDEINFLEKTLKIDYRNVNMIICNLKAELTKLQEKTAQEITG